MVLAWIVAAARAWRDWRLEGNADRVVLLAASLAPLVWVRTLPGHMFIHATCMVRIVVASTALIPLALSWPSSGRRVDAWSWGVRRPASEATEG
jgi:hypothetical protein